MAFVSGKFVMCAWAECGSTSLIVVRESFNERELVFVGEQKCETCGSGMLYSRRPETPEEIAMVKKKKKAIVKARAQKPVPTKRARRQTVTHRLNTINPNGGRPASQEVAPEKVSVGEAMRRAVEQLGPVTIDAQLAAAQMEELAVCYDEIAKRQAAYDAKSEEAKTAKKSLESAENLLLERVREFTHAASLPLFDETQAEDDLDNMTKAGADQDAEVQ